MALPDYEFMDGFDKYGPLNTDSGLAALNDNEWSSVSSANYTLVAPLAGDGQAIATSIELEKILPTSYARCLGGCYIQWLTTSPNLCIPVKLADGATDTCTITIGTDGSIQVRRGSDSGTIVQSYSTKLLALNEIAFLAWDITVHNSTGAVKVWRNGELIINATGQDLSATANNSYSRIAMSGSGSTHNYDHWFSWHYLASGGVEVPPTDGPIIDTDFPTSDDSVDFTLAGATLGTAAAGGTQSNGGGSCLLRRVTCEAAGNLVAIAARAGSSSAIAKFKGVIYADSGGSPAALLGTSDETVGATSGTDITCTFSTPVAVTAGTTYWIGMHSDTAVTKRIITDGVGWSQTRSYALGPSDPMTGSSTSIEVSFTGLVTGTSVAYAGINDNYPVSISGHGTSSSSLNDEDLFGFPALPLTPANIYSVHLKAMAMKSDGGARTVDLRTKSGSTTGSGSNAGQEPSLNDNYLSSVFQTNPDTGSPWSGDLSGVKHGYKIVS